MCGIAPIAVAQDEEDEFDEFGKVSTLPEPKAGESIVFGHVTFILDGKVQKWGWTGSKACCLIILPDDSNETVSSGVKDDGMFYLALKPGGYRVLAFRYQQESRRRVGRIDASFTVPEGAAAVYIGNIRTYYVYFAIFYLVGPDSYLGMIVTFLYTFYFR